MSEVYEVENARLGSRHALKLFTYEKDDPEVWERADVVGTLETYDPVWKRIIPKLLHSNPQGRECLSYADEKRQDLGKAEFEWEERWLKEKCRGHLARHVARYVGLVTVAFAAIVRWLFGHYDRKVAEKAAQVNALEARLEIPSFSDVFHPLESAEEFPMRT